MNASLDPLVRKEIRLMLPSFVAALVLALSMWLVPHRLDADWRAYLLVLPYALCPAMAVVMALASFGAEISGRTFAGLLAQPVPRARIWRMKTVVLGAGLSLVGAVWWCSWVLHAPIGGSGGTALEMALWLMLAGLAIFSGGLWTVLLIRQVAPGFWFTLLVPAVLLALVVEGFDLRASRLPAVLSVVLLGYSVAGYFWARRMFLRAQDVSWTGGTISLPRGSWAWVLGWRTKRPARRGWGPKVALVAKELQFHQAQWVIAAGLVVLHLVLLGARRWSGGINRSPFLEFLADNFWVLWLAMPVLIGGAAAAEERNLRTWEAQLCLPVRRHTQFVVKAAVVLAASVILGALMPVLIEGTRILPEISWSLDGVRPGGGEPGGIMKVLWALFTVVRPIVPVVSPYLPLVGAAAGFAAMAFYASTLTRSTLQALGPALAGILVAFLLLMGASDWEVAIRYGWWRGPLIYLIGVPVLTILPGWLAWRNFQMLQVGWQMWWRNLVALLGALGLVTAATTLIYQRVWEILTPAEPPHGVARLARSDAVVLAGHGPNLLVQLPGGRLWEDRFFPSVRNFRSMLSGDWTMVSTHGGRFWEGSNWVSTAQCWLDVVGIRRDGTLWVSDKPEDPHQFFRVRTNAPPEPIRLVQVGRDTDWKRVAGGSTAAILLKTDGTLWRLGIERGDRPKPWPGLRGFEPVRLGTDHDWADLSLLRGQQVFRKKDGRAWVRSAGRPREPIRLDADTVLGRWLTDDGTWQAQVWLHSPREGGFVVSLREDGTLWVSHGSPGKRPALPLEPAASWRTVAGMDEFLLALRDDDTLWRWHPRTRRMTRFGTQADWKGLCAYSGGLAALAADGSLWYWQSEPRRAYPSEFTMPLLAASRRPQRLGDVFAADATR